MITYDAVVLAGGQGMRLGGVSKADLYIGEQRLLDIVLAAVPAARTRVVVGEVDVPWDVLRTMEEPPGGGPVAGIQAGLDAITEPCDWTVVMAVDHPGAEPAVRDLLAAVVEDDPADGWLLADADGTLQWLLGVHRTASLRRAIAASGADGVAMRRMLSSLTLNPVPTAADLTDLDTPPDLAHWGAELPTPPEPPAEA